MRGQQNQHDEYQLQKLIMFDLGPEGLPQVTIALLVRLSRDVQESSTRSLLRKLVPQFRKSALLYFPWKSWMTSPSSKIPPRKFLCP